MPDRTIERCYAVIDNETGVIAEGFNGMRLTGTREYLREMMREFGSSIAVLNERDWADQFRIAPIRIVEESENER
jgi:hypothetical protein